MHNYLQRHFFHLLNLTHPSFNIVSLCVFSKHVKPGLGIFFPWVLESRFLPPGKLVQTRHEENEEGNVDGKTEVMEIAQGQSQKFNFVQEGKGGPTERRKSVIDSSSWGGLSDQRVQW